MQTVQDVRKLALAEGLSKEEWRKALNDVDSDESVQGIRRAVIALAKQRRQESLATSRSGKSPRTPAVTNTCTNPQYVQMIRLMTMMLMMTQSAKAPPPTTSKTSAASRRRWRSMTQTSRC
eukprot:COSAG04_NODE_1261_length_7504_cov_2.488184_10_plen_121_part_00